MRENYKKICDGNNLIHNNNNTSNSMNNSQSNIIGNAEMNFPNISDHLWNNIIFLKYSRKLNLSETYKDFSKKFSEISSGLESLYPVEIYMKNMEDFKYIRNISKNYDIGIQIANELIEKINIINIGNSNATSNSFAQLYNSNYTIKNSITPANHLNSIPNQNIELDKEYFINFNNKSFQN